MVVEINWNIQDIIGIVALILSTIAIFQTRKSIRLTEIAFREVNRPIVVVYLETFDTIYFEKYLTVKNFGNSAAKILSIEFQSRLDSVNDKTRLQSLVNSVIDPNQKFETAVDTKFKDSIEGIVTYRDFNGIIYSESFTVNCNVTESLRYFKQRLGNETDEIHALKMVFQSLLRTLK